MTTAQRKKVATIPVTGDDVRLLIHTLHKMQLIGGGEIYMDSLEAFVERVRAAVSGASQEKR